MKAKAKRNRKPGICDATRCQITEDLQPVAAGTLFDLKVGDVSLCPQHLSRRQAEVQAGTGQAPSPIPEVLAPGETPTSGPSPVQVEMASETKEAKEILALVKTYQIRGQADMDFADTCLEEVKAKYENLKTRQKDATGPMLKSLEVVRNWFRPALDHYKECERLWKAKLAACKQAQEQAQEQALASVQQAHQAGDPSGVAAAMVRVSEASVELPTAISIRERWRSEIIQPELLPPEYWSPDPRKVQVAVDQGQREILGCKIWRDDIVTRRGS